MTIIIGLICKNTIVLASDSQTTYSSSTGASQRLDTPKITVLQFSNSEALVAQSGDATLSGRAVEILCELSKGQSLSDYRSVADLAQKAIRKLKDELREQNLNCSMEALHEYIQREQLNFELMIAHYHDKKPHIFTIDFAIGIAARKPHLFTAIGCGSGIANYILSWFTLGDKMEFTHGMLAALYVIEEVKKVDPYCGGQARVAMLASGGFKGCSDFSTGKEMLNFMLEADQSVYVNELAALDKKAKSEWMLKMNEVLLAATAKLNSTKPAGN